MTTLFTILSLGLGFMSLVYLASASKVMQEISAMVGVLCAIALAGLAYLSAIQKAVSRKK